MSIKAIETLYAGYRFRSRLEARFAVAFTAAGVDWQYEPEGYETSHGNYLPDFRIRTAVSERAAILRGCAPTWWLEVKHEDYTASPHDQRRYLALAEGTNQPLVLVYGLDGGGMFITPEGKVFTKRGDVLDLGSAALTAARSARFDSHNNRSRA